MQYGNHNYGAVLQAAALANTLEEIGCEVEHIDFCPQLTLYQKVREVRLQTIKKYLLIIFKKLFAKQMSLQLQVVGREVFENFRLKWLKRTSKTFLHSQELKEYKFNYDVVIVGSDQVWRLKYNRENITTFFLDFVSPPIRKIAYAASFGLDYFESGEEGERRRQITKLLKQFSAISVRETSGVKICQKMFDVNAVQVIDPTLLAGVEFFNKIIESENSFQAAGCSDVVCCVFDYSKFLRKLLLELQDKNITTDIIYPIKEIEGTQRFISVALWLKRIKEAKFVITDSFHCVCISLLFEKNFVCVANQERGISRLNDLLGEVNLRNRIITNNDDISKVIKLLNENIQYDEVRNYFTHKRKDALQFLQKSLFD